MKRKRGIQRIGLLLAALTLVCALSFASGEDIVIPELEIPRREIPENDALRLIQELKAGWNLGNTFDATDCYWVKDPMDYESAWCGVKTSEHLVEALVNAGFRTLRIPVSWHNHLSADGTIDEAWLDRVREVASWAYDRGMYVIVNIHHDDGADWYYPDTAHAESSEKYMRTVWTQLAAKFADFDTRLIFESVNEPRLKGTEYEWWWDPDSASCRDAMARIVALNQVFVDTVRASGGYNAERYLMVPAYDANPEYACKEAFTLPADSVENRIIVSAHAYTPYDFALQQPGVSAFSLEGNQKADIDWFMDQLFETWVSKGIPVLIGEFGAMEKNGNLQDRVDWVSYYVASARARGISCCWWDNHLFSGQGERFGLFDRNTGACVNPEILEAIMKYSE